MRSPAGRLQPALSCHTRHSGISHGPIHTGMDCYWKGAFNVLDFIALVTAHIPPKHKQYIRRYGLYSSRSRGKWKEHEHLCRLAPDGWKEKQEIAVTVVQEEASQEAPAAGTKQQRSAWAKLIKKVYGVDPLICPKCGSEMKIIAIIMDPEETAKILRHLIKTGKSPPGLDPNSLN
jgi:hypothetical protein